MRYEMSLVASTLGLVVLFSPVVASAQSAPVPAPGVGPAAADPPVAEPASSCGAGVIRGVHPADGETAVWLICEDAKRRGTRPAALAPTDPAPFYRVGLMRLGQTVVVTLHVEAPVGTVRDGRQLRLNSVDEVAIAGPRLVDALVFGTPVDSTQRVNTLVGQETRKYEKKHGEFLFGGGLMGLYFVGSEGGVRPALELQLGYETPRFAIGIDTRFTVGSDHNNEGKADYSALGIGGRYFFSEGDISPYVGGGLALSSMDLQKADNRGGGHWEGSGLGLYHEVGVELLRLHSSRLTFGLRVETPFYEMKGDYDFSYASYDPDSNPIGAEQPPKLDDRYGVPVMAGLSFTF